MANLGVEEHFIYLIKVNGDGSRRIEKNGMDPAYSVRRRTGIVEQLQYSSHRMFSAEPV
jgi:hypothetical protein